MNQAFTHQPDRSPTPDLFDVQGAALTAHEHIGFELGWDYAHHRLVPPAPYGLEPSPLRNGLLAGDRKSVV